MRLPKRENFRKHASVPVPACIHASMLRPSTDRFANPCKDQKA